MWGHNLVISSVMGRQSEGQRSRGHGVKGQRVRGCSGGGGNRGFPPWGSSDPTLGTHLWVHLWDQTLTLTLTLITLTPITPTLTPPPSPPALELLKAAIAVP